MKKNRFLVAAILFAAVCTTTLVSCKKDKNAEPKDPSTEQNGDNQNEPPTSDVVTYTLTVLSNDEEMGTVTGGGTYAIGTEATLTATPTSEEYVFVRWNDDNTSSQRVIKVIANETYTAYFDVRPSTDTEDNPKWVDLGLPSGLKWAICNIGASKPEEYGNHYAWGETEPKSYHDYTLTAYKWMELVDSKTIVKKYCTDANAGTVDNKTVLEPEDDAATVNWGGKWRMPTNEEWTELQENCTWTWVENFNGSGKNGYEVKGANGNAIFLPAAGFYCDGKNIDGVGSAAPYWSSSLYTTAASNSNAWMRLCYSTDILDIDAPRYYGHSVRAVTE